MAIEVRIPTILRTYTGGAKSVEGSGTTLAEVIGDLDTRYGGLRDRLQDESGLRRFVNVYLNDEDVRFLGGLETPVKDGDTVTVLPAVAGGAHGVGRAVRACPMDVQPAARRPCGHPAALPSSLIAPL